MNLYFDEHLAYFVHVILIGDTCVDTDGWHDNINNSTCSDYVDHGWCVDNSLSSAMKVHSTPSLNFPELNCCACGKRGEKFKTAK